VRERPDTNDLRAAWERNSREWIRWARDEGLDAHYLSYHRDLFLELAPAPSGRTLDLGCGEGRLTRELAARGHDVVGVDLSPTLLAAAREVSPELEFHEADAAALPFPDASFELVLAFMSLQDMDDLEGAIAEAGRMLAPGGSFCLAVVHPLNSAGEFVGDDATSPFVIEGSYLGDSFFTDLLERDGELLRLESAHRPIERYAEALADAGLLIDRLREPRLPESAFRNDRAARWTRIPLFLHLRAVKPRG
jgi:SAM-dependent methyltransferase